MENNMMKIAERLYILSKQQELITEDTELNILYQISDELLSDMGEIEQYENVKKALVNMFIVGELSRKNTKKVEMSPDELEKSAKLALDEIHNHTTLCFDENDEHIFLCGFNAGINWH